MELTKDERHTLYILMQAELEAELTLDTGDGFCYMLCKVFDFEDSSGGYDDIIEEYLPELEKRKPKKLYNDGIGLWFCSNSNSNVALEKRIQILKECIEETY